MLILLGDRGSSFFTIALACNRVVVAQQEVEHARALGIAQFNIRTCALYVSILPLAGTESVDATCNSVIRSGTISIEAAVVVICTATRHRAGTELHKCTHQRQAICGARDQSEQRHVRKKQYGTVAIMPCTNEKNLCIKGGAVRLE